ncbi:unnamed protein product [Malus baccata var. baccata]
MGNTEKLMNQIMELKFTSKSLQLEKLKIKKAMEKGNVDSAQIYVENAIRKRIEQMNYLRLFVNMEVQAEFMETAMAGSTSLSTPEGEVNSLMQQVVDDMGFISRYYQYYR